MPIPRSRAQQQMLDYLREGGGDQEALFGRLNPKHHAMPPRVPGGTRVSDEALDQRWQQTLADRELFRKNIEYFVGTVKVPIGLAGPLRVNGLFAQGDYYVPLATTEAALVASYNRGAQLITEAGGCSVALLSEGVSRAPCFAFNDMHDTGVFLAWVLGQLENFEKVVSGTTSHGKLVDMRLTVEGNHVFINFDYTTGDASGQNMVTIATQAILGYIDENTPVKPQHYFIESNMSGDKKANGLAFTSVRGKKVTAEVLIPGELVGGGELVMEDEAEELGLLVAGEGGIPHSHHRGHRRGDQQHQGDEDGAMGSALIGTFGVQGHYANGLTALFMACGQDVACVAESAVGVGRLEVTDKNELYATVTLPNLMVGTVGGGTGLPSQKACLEIMGLHGEGKARALAEVAAALVLGGELSINGAMSCGEFTRAHQRLARGRQNHTESPV